MKNLLFLFFLMSNVSLAQTNDKEEVEKVIKLYLRVTD